MSSINWHNSGDLYSSGLFGGVFIHGFISGASNFDRFQISPFTNNVYSFALAGIEFIASYFWVFSIFSRRSFASSLWRSAFKFPHFWSLEAFGAGASVGATGGFLTGQPFWMIFIKLLLQVIARYITKPSFKTEEINLLCTTVHNTVCCGLVKWNKSDGRKQLFRI